MMNKVSDRRLAADNAVHCLAQVVGSMLMTDTLGGKLTPLE